MLFFWHPATSKKKKKKKKKRAGLSWLTNGCWVVLSNGTYWVRQKVICGFPHSIMMTRRLIIWMSMPPLRKLSPLSGYKPFTDLVQCNMYRLMLSVILHIFLMFTRRFNIQHMESRRACALVNAATPCKILNAHHSLLRHGIHEYCIET